MDDVSSSVLSHREESNFFFVERFLYRDDVQGFKANQFSHRRVVGIECIVMLEDEADFHQNILFGFFFYFFLYFYGDCEDFGSYGDGTPPLDTISSMFQRIQTQCQWRITRY